MGKDRFGNQAIITVERGRIVIELDINYLTNRQKKTSRLGLELALFQHIVKFFIPVKPDILLLNLFKNFYYFVKIFTENFFRKLGI